MIRGVVQYVETIDAGNFLAVAADAGATVLELSNASVFATDAEGGSVNLGGDLYDYVDVDTEADTITLAVGLATAAELNTPVYVHPLVPDKSAWVVLDDGLGDAISARVPIDTAVFTALADGPRDFDERDAVRLEQDGSGYVVLEVVGVEPLLEGARIDPDSTIPAGALSEASPWGEDPPDVAPLLTLAPFAVGVVRASWTQVGTAMEYEVFASLSDTIDTTTATPVGRISGTRFDIGQVDGANLPMGEAAAPVRAVVRAANPNGPGPDSNPASATARQADNEFISALFAYLGAVQVDQLTGGRLDALISFVGRLNIAADGETPLISITPPTVDSNGLPVGGIEIFDPAAPTQVLVRLHPAGCTFKGRIITDLLTVLEEVEVNFKMTLKAGSTTRIENGISDPTVAPVLTSTTIQSTWPAVPAGYTQRSVCWDATNSRWLRLLQNTSTKRGHLQPVSTAGVAGSIVALGVGSNLSSGNVAVEVSGLTFLGGSVYYVQVVNDTFSEIVRAVVIRCNPTTGGHQSSIGHASLESGTSSVMPGEYGLGNAGTSVYVVGAIGAQIGNESHVFVSKYGAGLDTFDGEFQLLGADASNAYRFVSVSDHGYGAAKTTVVHSNKVDVYPVGAADASVSKDAALSWSLAASAFNGGVAYKTSGTDQGFYSTHGTGVLHRYSSYYATAGEKWWAKHADTGTGTTKTTASPLSSGYAIASRRFAQVQLPVQRNGVTGAELYVGYGPTAPGTLYKRSESVASRVAILTAGKDTGGSTSVPAVNTMGGAPGKVVDDAVGYWKGNGDTSWNEYASVAQTANAAATGTENITLAGLSAEFDCPGAAAVYEVTISADVIITTGTNIIVALANGVEAIRQLVTQGNGTRQGGSRTWIFTGLAAGPATFTARTRNTAASTDTSVRTNTTMTVRRVR